MLEVKEFAGVIGKRANVQRLIEILLTENANQSSQNAALGVLVQLIQLYNDMLRNQARKNSEDEEDETTIHQTEEEKENTINSLLSSISGSIPSLVKLLDNPVAANV